MPSNNCLILACSDKKKNITGPALQVYDGQLFQTLRKYPPTGLDIFILSGKYGLIPAEKEIQPYNRHISERPWTLMEAADQWRRLGLDRYQTIYTCMGWDYWTIVNCVALEVYGPNDFIPLVKIPDGKAPIGKMKAALGEFCRQHQGVLVPCP